MAEFFGALGKFRGDVRLHAQRPGTVGHFLRAGSQVQQRARGVARRAERAHVGVHAPHRRGEPPPPDVPSLPEASPAHDEAPGPALLRPLRAARLVGRSQLLHRRSTGHRPQVARAARARVCGRGAPIVHRTMDRLLSDRRQAGWRLLERRRVRRAPVHADQLQREVHRHEHRGARARAHDAELLLEQDAALPDGVLSHLRGRSRLDLQRGAPHRPHAQDDQGRRDEAVAARQLPRGHQIDGLPPDAVRRVRAARARDGREGRAADRRGARQALRGHHEEVLRPRQGRLHRRRLHRARVGVHPALLPELLRLPVRDVVHGLGRALGEGDGRRQGGAQALPGLPQRRWIRSTRSTCSRTPAST